MIRTSRLITSYFYEEGAERHCRMNHGQEGKKGKEDEPQISERHELRAIERAAPGVQKAVRELMDGFLATCPNHTARIGGYRVKKLPDRGVRQIDLPDDYRLRYCVDETERVVYIVYLGPHLNVRREGREHGLLARLNQRREKT